MGMEGLQNLAEPALREGWRRVRLWLLASLVIMAICLFMMLSQPAHAATCVPLQPMLDQLVKRYHEFIVVTGNAGDQHMIVTMSDAGTFTVLLSDGKQACIILAGEKAALDNGI
ncbi:hypothetical protein FJV76_14220 [Mesorhizobium sp. WSM4303]|uniref:hypothetical protein n=1 Tax=Mesorhizobium sp. WSM4303 TaxID=2589887 RepID=UPI00115E3DCC|nr:hypothetical protein [Mesorhizobium sp. WSM4303]TRD03789.1 hypothetical protein FJV76_14220 [Mesorhizobium sp. WSM4303]